MQAGDELLVLIREVEAHLVKLADELGGAVAGDRGPAAGAALAQADERRRLARARARRGGLGG